MRVQLWSYNYDPEPTGIGPVSTVWAKGLRELGHTVEVVAAHPHYPEPSWGTRSRPYRELRDGIPVLRLPLWVGRESSLQRYRQELSFMAAQALAAPFLSKPDVLVSASPSFPALLPAIVASRARRIPWVLWLHDILPDGAAASGLVSEASTVLRASRWLERTAYRSADRIVVLSSAFTENLVAKGVEPGKIELIYDPATRVPANGSALRRPPTGTRLMVMGNIGFSQGLAELVDGFERAPEANADVSLVITGNGMEADAVRANLRTQRVEMMGLVDDASLERELAAATIGLVTQRHTGSEFNIPSKLMNYMAYGLPVLAVVNPGGEVARIVNESRAGWVVDSRDPEDFPRALTRILADRADVDARGDAARRYAEAHFTQRAFSRRFSDSLVKVLAHAT